MLAARCYACKTVLLSFSLPFSLPRYGYLVQKSPGYACIIIVATSATHHCDISYRILPKVWRLRTGFPAHPPTCPAARDMRFFRRRKEPLTFGSGAKYLVSVLPTPEFSAGRRNAIEVRRVVLTTNPAVPASTTRCPESLCSDLLSLRISPHLQRSARWWWRTLVACQKPPRSAARRRLLTLRNCRHQNRGGGRS